MLVLTRREGEVFLLGDDIEIEILDIQPSVVRIGIRAPRSVRVLRSELLEAVVAANREAAAVGTLGAAQIAVEAHAVVRGA
ncbi:MAG TPA: carbon storage regulator [Ilumatobacteraceae bacterium]|jgi:carbon storage regulator